MAVSRGRRHWDEGYSCWIYQDPFQSAEDEFFSSIDDEEENLMPEVFLALQSLTPKQRFAIEFRYGLRGPSGSMMGVEDIAEMMGISHAAVVKLIQRGLRRLGDQVCHLRTKKANTTSGQ